MALAIFWANILLKNLTFNFTIKMQFLDRTCFGYGLCVFLWLTTNANKLKQNVLKTEKMWTRLKFNKYNISK